MVARVAQVYKAFDIGCKLKLIITHFCAYSKLLRAAFKQVIRTQSYKENSTVNLLYTEFLVLLLAENGHVTFCSQ